ncbi:MAG: hypothetical protein CM15mP49_35330 [Actinomycetota bacterium]|nr:MAG: hypothetical protein CM15mP49_35330 [Actinomycetota bacterium]
MDDRAEALAADIREHDAGAKRSLKFRGRTLDEYLEQLDAFYRTWFRSSMKHDKRGGSVLIRDPQPGMRTFVVESVQRISCPFIARMQKITLDLRGSEFFFHRTR